MKLKFIKMNGAGNDFVIIDRREAEKTEEPLNLTPEQIRTLSSRDNDVTKGCDQLIIIEPSTKADIFMRIYNADGGEVDACGNATRCVADMLYKELERLPVTIETNAGILRGVKEELTPEGKQYIHVDMGVPEFNWQNIPLAITTEEATEKVVDFINMPKLGTPTFISMGNPHLVFFVDNLPSNDEVAVIGAKVENYTDVFPERVNVSFAKMVTTISDSNEHIIYAKVWERGAGLTKACGTGACAILAAANRRNKDITNAPTLFRNSDEFVFVSLGDDNHILLGGKVEKEFEGTVEI